MRIVLATTLVCLGIIVLGMPWKEWNVPYVRW